MNGDRPTQNGDRRIPNGFEREVSASIPESASLKEERLPSKSLGPLASRDQGYANGQSKERGSYNPSSSQDVASRSPHAPLEVLQLVSKDSYLPLAALISRASQSCWNGLSGLIDQLATLQVPDHLPDPTKALPNGHPNNQSKANLEKKEKLLSFTNDQKADFIKLLVLLQWSRDVDDVSKTISINYWLMTRRQAYWDAIASLALVKRDSAGFQMPDPDLKTAAEILSRGKTVEIPTLGYIPSKTLSSKQILGLLQSLNRRLSIKLALSEEPPPQLERFHIHDGRATFVVPAEFFMDVSILDDRVDSPFRLVDLRFAFSPAPTIPDNMRHEIEHYANANIDRDGLHGCYLFLHELALSFKLTEYHKQALELSRTQWAGNLRVELIRRTLVAQYWSDRMGAKSWIEIGISSGHHEAENANNPPFLDIKWMRRNQEVPSPGLSMDQSVLSLETILRQVIARDSTLRLDDIYDSLISTPLFATSELTLEQTLSTTDPELCVLTMQLARSIQLQLRVDPVTGSFTVSPVTDKTERLQLEINRSHGNAGELASKLLNFRCSVMEASISNAVLSTSWEMLRAFKFSQSEIKSLFGIPIVRLNIFRQTQWGSDYFLAISHAHTGDRWWLLHQVKSSDTAMSASFQVIRSQKIGVLDRLSPAFFDRLSEYTTGVICLLRNADYLKQRNDSYHLPSFPDFGDAYKLPELSVALDSPRSETVYPNLHSEVSALDGTGEIEPPLKTIKLRFDCIDRSTNLATLIGTLQVKVRSDILQNLDRSTLDPSVSLNPTTQSATIRSTSSISEAAIPSIVDKAIHLENIVSTVQQIHRLPGLKLQKLLKSGFSILYHTAPPKELSVNVIFRNKGQPPRLTFFPVEDNPHALLAEKYSDMLATGQQPFATRIHEFLTSMTMTYPLLYYLHNLQRKYGGQSKVDTQIPGTDGHELRVHVLIRSAQHFAIQYFTSINQPSKDGGLEDNANLLARFEIVPHVDNASQKPMWLVRAALEEFQAYSRPSFSTSALRARLRQEIFARTDAPSPWLMLDSAAACLADQPETLLKEIHDVLTAFTKETAPGEKDAAAKVEPQKIQLGSVPNGSTKAKPQRPPGKLQAPLPSPGGTVKQPQQRNNSIGTRPVPAKGQGKANAPNNQDNPITLD